MMMPEFVLQCSDLVSRASCGQGPGARTAGLQRGSCGLPGLRAHADSKPLRPALQCRLTTLLPRREACPELALSLSKGYAKTEREAYRRVEELRPELIEEQPPRCAVGAECYLMVETAVVSDSSYGLVVLAGLMGSPRGELSNEEGQKDGRTEKAHLGTGEPQLWRCSGLLQEDAFFCQRGSRSQ